MKTVGDACQLQPNALFIKLSDQIEQLDELIQVEGEGAAFFAKTNITQGMRYLHRRGHCTARRQLLPGRVPPEAGHGRR